MDQKIIISHRGNLDGPNPVRENRLDYISEALKVVLFCEVDLWKFGEYLFLSHDKPVSTNEYQVGVEHFLYENKDKLVIHCKNIQALQMMTGLKNSYQYNYFWHENDAYTLTSAGWIWAYPDKQVFTTRHQQVDTFSVAVMPEINDTDTKNFMAICTDFVHNYMHKNNFYIKELKVK